MSSWVMSFFQMVPLVFNFKLSCFHVRVKDRKGEPERGGE
jgi:hypothetical protein